MSMQVFGLKLVTLIRVYLKHPGLLGLSGAYMQMPMISALDFQVIPSVFPSSLFSSNSFSLLGSSTQDLTSSVSLLGLQNSYVNPFSTGIFLNQIRAHHLFVGLALILAGLVIASGSFSMLIPRPSLGQISSKTWHAYLSFMLALLGSISIVSPGI